jgi:hypothetical protein
MIETTYSDKNGNTVKSIFGIKDDIVRGVLAAINELIREDITHPKTILLPLLCKHPGSHNLLYSAICYFK